VKLPQSEAKLIMRDLRAVSAALDQFKVARGHYPEARTIQDLEAELAPTYLRAVPRHDRWKHPLRYETWKEKPEEEGPQHYSIGSPGANGKFEKEPLRARVLEAPKDSGADIILTDGRFISTPEPQADDAPASLAGLAETQGEKLDPDLLFSQATALYRNSDFDRAIPLFQQFLALRPEHALATARLAASYCHSGRFDDAVPVLQRAIKLNPADYQSQANLALTYERLQKPELAIEPAQEAAKVQPENSDVLNILGNVLISAGRPAEAIEPLEKATRANPDNMMAFYNLGVACHRIGKDERAMRVLKVLDLRAPARAQDLRVELNR
jgi:Flp pilus assembly protein TadD